MTQRPTLLDRAPAEGGSVLIVRAPAGPARTRLLETLVDDARVRGARAWLLDCDFTDGGPWAGIHDLFLSLVDELKLTRPELIVRHDYELAHAVPALQRTVQVRNPTLTDLAPPEEKVRNYPADRAFRIVHGLIDLLAAHKETSAPEASWVIVCEGFDRISRIGARFFRELMRRRGRILRLTLVVAADEADAWEGSYVPSQTIAVDLPAGAKPAPDPAVMARRAVELDAEIAEDRLLMQVHLPEILRCARLGERADLLLKWRFRALEIYNTLGLYEEARVYGEAVREALRGRQTPAHEAVRWAMFLKLIMCYLGLGDVDAAYAIATDPDLGEIAHPEWKCQHCYLLAMLYARYLPERDLAKAEEYLERGLQALEGKEIAPERRHFQHAFNRNGLALVRHLQGRYDDAIALCRGCHAYLEEHLNPERHRLHRSVLLYNLAQVYSAVGARDEAIAHYTAAMEMDPSYSEYYNERGGLLLQSGRLAEAWEDYGKAIELSPPYYESFTNLGQCARRLGRPREAVEAYSRALDLEPERLLPLLGRAQAHEDLGQAEEAVADYTAALALEPGLWDAYANRAVLRYQAGQLAESLADLSRAIELAGSQADLYQNRALVLADLDEPEAAAEDLRAYLALRPDADDREEVACRLRELSVGSVAAVPA